MDTRILHTTDIPVVEVFLRKYADSSMILRGNLLLDGIEDHGGRWSGVYAGAFDSKGELRAVVAHYSRGNVVLQADDDEALASASALAVRTSNRPVRGVLGTGALVIKTRELLCLTDAPVQYDEDEGLYALDLARLKLPPLASSAGVELRPLQRSDAEIMVNWRCDYDIEGLGAEDGPKLRAQSRETFERSLAHGEPILLTDGGVPCAMTEFNARLPDMRQVGGVYTPPANRNRGYARTAVGLSLLDARKRGVERAMLFTRDDNLAAITAYRSLGFERVGDFRITLLRE